MTVRELMQKVKKIYQISKGERFFTQNALLSAVFSKNGMNDAERFRSFEQEISQDFSEAILRDAKSLCEGAPLQYYLGTEFFMGLEFEVREGVLIPRTDTEVLVQFGIEYAPKDAVVFDLCCGSGCVGAALLFNREDLICRAYDINSEAVLLSEKNAKRLALQDRMKCFCRDILSASFREELLDAKPDMILCNPPYLSLEEMGQLEENVRREPAIALYGGEDGLIFYRRLLSLAREDKIPLACEIGYRQEEAIRYLAAQEGLTLEFRADAEGRPRAFYTDAKG